MNHAYTLIDFLRLPRPHGERRTEHGVRARRSQNQFTPLGAGVNKLIFKRFWIFYVSLPIVILFFNVQCIFFKYICLSKVCFLFTLIQIKPIYLYN